MTTAIITREPIKVVADILLSELDLTTDQIILEYQKLDISTQPGLFIALDYIAGKAIGSNNSATDDEDGMLETQQVAMNHLIQIDLMSFNAEARTRKEEVIMALRSIYSQQAQDANDMQIARIPLEFQNASSLEETKILNRFTMTIVVKSVYTRTRTPTFYDTFAKEINYDPKGD